MSTNAAFAGPVPGGRPGSGTQRAIEAGELERWYTDQRAWPVRRDECGRLWLEAGTEFDVLEVPEAAGRRALRRLIGYGQAALAPGPVALSEAAAPPDAAKLSVPGRGDAAVRLAATPEADEPGIARCCFFVAPGARDDLPELLDWLDWGGIDLGLRAHGLGDRIPAPTPQRWLHNPLAVPPEVIALLATIAESCSRYALTRRAF
ncbi:hypothetical protein KGA66_21355 [Actinocrinis puniceicyclus]|uniref:Uncharacterized protein n=1 Tax=Actinocrinis puniceicyclus TaxID=977794 RepID=A0A8J7WTA1_9ACTN|nr:hypothetical protein [Actinocrinis puniceicyclus]MBS2965612.1 hypothetical protein [Actinocrinis puniceicyclus]